MPLVTVIIGDCPECGAENAFGNISVGSDAVNRGCMFCKYGYSWPLPPIRKNVIYLDQFCFSRAFRQKRPAQDQKYVDAFARLKELARRQVLVAPYSSVHEDETHQWAGDNAQTHEQLMDFIKCSSGGHKLERSSHVHTEQLISAFQRFLKREPVDPQIDRSDALPSDLHDWTDYFWIDVGGYFNDATKIGQAKQEAIAALVRIMPQWRGSKNDFEADLAVEYRGAATGYMNAFQDYLERAVSGDLAALFNAPMLSTVVRSMLEYVDKNSPEHDQIPSVMAFFGSDHFKTAPYQWLSARAITVLKEQIRRNKPTNFQEAAQKISSDFDDIEHVATYAPYCDAVFVDKRMAAIMLDPRVNLTKRYGTRVFSETNWKAFEAWLDSLDANLSPEHLEGLSYAYPVSIANPIEVMRSRNSGA